MIIKLTIKINPYISRLNFFYAGNILYLGSNIKSDLETIANM